MNYWLTTQWPTVMGEEYSGPHGVYLPNGRQEAAIELKPGDHVFIYQSRTGRGIIRRNIFGKDRILKHNIGRQGIIALEEVLSELEEDIHISPENYTDGSTIWWKWYANTKTISEIGFVNKRSINNILGYSLNYSLRGFGDLKSGLKRLTPDQFNSLLSEFNRIHNRNIKLALSKKHPKKYKTRPGERSESKEHKALKEYVAAHPIRVFNETGINTLAVEYEFYTADRADVVLQDKFGRIIGLEVEVSMGPKDLAGFLQAIKYRFMLAPMFNIKYSDTRAALVAYSLSSEIIKLCKEYDVEFYTVDKSDIIDWFRKTP